MYNVGPVNEWWTLSHRKDFASMCLILQPSRSTLKHLINEIQFQVHLADHSIQEVFVIMSSLN